MLPPSSNALRSSFDPPLGRPLASLVTRHCLMKHVIIGTAGHIDHGKSSLVLALTGTDPDRWAEEKRRGITIDLGFAFLDLGDVRIGFVDVPGHERFVKNMLAGVGGIDLLMLVVAADEAIKPQTREHFDIARLLGIPRGFTVITKSDLVDAEQLELVRLEVEEFLRGSFLEGAPVVAASVRTPGSLDELKKTLHAAAQAAPARDASQHFRLPIDRAFAMKGFGSVVTGTLISGSVAVEDEVELFPAQRRVRVRGIQSGGESVTQAGAGQRTALNLAGVSLDELARGMTLAAVGLFRPTRQLDARVTLLPAASPLKNRARVHFHHGAAETIAEVVLLEGEKLAPGADALVQLRLNGPVLALPGDRFIIRQFSPLVTIGGGVVLDAFAPRHRQRETFLPLLHALERGQPGDILGALTAAEPRGLNLAEIIARTGWMPAQAAEVIGQLSRDGKTRVVSEQPLVVVSAAAFEKYVQDLGAALGKFHKGNPLIEGIPREDLRERAAAGARPEVFRAALEQAVKAGVAAITGDLVKRAGREISLLPEEARAKEQIEQTFAAAGLTVPPVKEVLAKLSVESRRAQKIVQLLLRENTLVKVSEDLLFHRSAVEKLRALLAAYKKQKGERLAIGAFKELAGISRKYAIPLLEYLDRERVTRRQGDERVIL